MGTIASKWEAEEEPINTIAADVLSYIHHHMVLSYPVQTFVFPAIDAPDQSDVNVLHPDRDLTTEDNNILFTIQRDLTECITILNTFSSRVMAAHARAGTELDDTESPRCVICMEVAGVKIPIPCPCGSKGTNNHLIHFVCWKKCVDNTHSCPLCNVEVHVADELSWGSDPTPPYVPTNNVVRRGDRSPPDVHELILDMISLAAKFEACMGLEAAWQQRLFAVDHMLITDEIDYLTASCPFSPEAHRGQTRRTFGTTITTGQTDFHLSHVGRAGILNPETYMQSFVRDGDTVRGVHYQVIHVPERQHWVLACISWDGPLDGGPEKIVILDSCQQELPAHKMSPSVLSAIRCMAVGPTDVGTVTVQFQECSQQDRGTACGLFCIANLYYSSTGAMKPFANHWEDNSPCTFYFDDDELYTWYWQQLCTKELHRFERHGSSSWNGTFFFKDMDPPPCQRLTPISQTLSFSDTTSTTTSCRRSSSRPKKKPSDVLTCSNKK